MDVQETRASGFKSLESKGGWSLPCRILYGAPARKGTIRREILGTCDNLHMSRNLSRKNISQGHQLVQIAAEASIACGVCCKPLCAAIHLDVPVCFDFELSFIFCAHCSLFVFTRCFVPCVVCERRSCVCIERFGQVQGFCFCIAWAVHLFTVYIDRNKIYTYMGIDLKVHERSFI